MAATNNQSPGKLDVEAALQAIASGRAIDWKGRHLPAEKLIKLLNEHSRGGAGQPISINNAVIDGDVQLDALGETGAPLHLQILNCRMTGGFRARGSKWRNLIIAETSLAFLDLPRATVARDLVLERIQCSSWLELRGSDIGGTLSLKSSCFEAGDRLDSAELSSIKVGENLDASLVRTKGCVDADNAKVGGDLRFDGADLDSSGLADPIALNLSNSRVGGQIRLCQAGSARFSAKGRVQLGAASCRELLFKAASLDGLGHPAVVADQITVENTLDLSGLSASGGPSLDVRGALRFGSSEIGRQVQIVDATIIAPEPAVIFHNANIGGDLLVGHPSASTMIDGGFTADLATIRGRILGNRLELKSAQTAFAARHAQVTQEITLNDVRASGAIRFSNSYAEGLSIEDTSIQRVAPEATNHNAPEHYAHPEDALLEVMFMRLRSDLRLERVSMDGGDLRMIGAQVEGGVQLSMLAIKPLSGHAIIAQSISIGGGFQLTGSPAQPNVIDGDFSLMGARIRDDVTIVDTTIGRDDKKSAIVLRNASIGTSCTVLKTTVFGVFNASGARIDGDLHFHSSRFLNPGDTAMDLRGVRVGGVLQWATATLAQPIDSEIHGLASADAATVGVLGWTRIRLLDDSLLALTNIDVQRQVEGTSLASESSGRLNLAGTTTPVLIDTLDDDEDSWGAGRVRLGLDNFAYGRLASPSGRSADHPADIKEWREKWLGRRFDPSSARPARHLAKVLRDQGLFEASRLMLMSAFSAEGRARPTLAGRGLAALFGALFGHGLSGSRAFVTLAAFWALGALGTVYLQDRHMLIDTTRTTGNSPCTPSMDPLIYAADVMIPLLDLGQEKRCSVGAAQGATPEPGEPAGIGDRTIFGELEKYRFLAALYQVLGWVLVSLAIATWSGLFRRGGRE